MPEPLRIAPLGCGFITGVHSWALQSLRGAIECGYASRDRAKADECCRRYSGVANCRDYIEMCLEQATDDQRLMDQIYATVGVAADHITPDQMAGHIGQ